MAHICSWRYIWTFDNFLRPFIHDLEAIYAPLVHEGMSVFDIGCGAGFTTLGLARLVGASGQIHALDLQPEMLAKVSNRAEHAGLLERIKLVQCAETKLGLTEQADFANAFWMVHEVPDPRAFLSEIFAHLRPHGKLLIAEPKFHVSAQAFEQTVTLAQEIGFSPEPGPRIRWSRSIILSK